MKCAVKITESQFKILTEQLVGGFVAPGDENTFETKEQSPDFGNFIMSARKSFDSGVTIGVLVDKIIKLPKPEPKGREENNDYEVKVGATPIYHPPQG